MSDLAAPAGDATTAVEPQANPSPPHPAPDASPKDATPGDAESNAQSTSGAGDPAATPEGDKGEQDRKRQTAQERINEVTAKRREAERREAAALARVAELERRLAPPGPQASLEEQDAYRIQQGLTQWRAEELRQDAAAARADIHQARFDKFAAKAEAIADRIPGLLEKFTDPNLKVSEHMADFVSDSEKGAEIAHFLSENPREAARIHALNPAHQGIELARLEARLSVATPVRKVSTAPNPPPTVTGNTSTASRDPSEMTEGEYIAWFKKREAAKRRG